MNLDSTPLAPIFFPDPFLHTFYYRRYPSKEVVFTSETTKRIINCPTFRNLKRFRLDVTSELFDFEMFAEAMKVRKKVFQSSS